MCCPSYHYNGFVEIYALGHMMYGYTLVVPKSAQQEKKKAQKKLIKRFNINLKNLPSLCIANFLQRFEAFPQKNVLEYVLRFSKQHP